MSLESFTITLLIGIIFGVGVAAILTPNESLDVSGVSDRERWDDLNNLAARDRFCQAQGYQQGRISINTGFQTVDISDRAGSPYGYDVYCIRSVEEHQIYDYKQYKKWLISLEITNKS